MASQPKAPDPYAQAAAQQGAEMGAAQGSAIINNPNVVNPYGSQSYKLGGYETIYDAQGRAQKVPRYTQTTVLSPDQQKLLGLQTQMQGNLGKIGVEQSAKIGNMLNTNLDTSGMADWQNYTADAGLRQDQGPTDRQAIEKAMMSRWEEDAGKKNAAQEAQLAARGMSPGSQGWSDVQQGQNRARTDAVNQAYLASGQESRQAQQAYNQAGQQRWQNQQDYANNMNQMRGAQLQEKMALRNQPINEITALMGGSQVTLPQFQPFSRQGVNSAPVGSYIGQNFAAQSQQANAFNQGLFGLGGSLLGGIGGMF